MGEDLHNVGDATPEKVVTAGVVYAIKKYLSNAVTLSELVDWVNVIASVMTLLETLDEGVNFTDGEYTQMIKCLETNTEYEL